jgi:hypothetical protein
MKALTLPELLALAKALGEHLQKVRDGKLVPRSREEITPGERLAVKFAGRHVAWVTMPKAPVRAAVKDKQAFLAFVKANLPGEVETAEQVREGTQRALLDAAKVGGWISPDGERVPVPGVEVTTGDPVPAVELLDGAAEAIGAAWRAGEADLSGLLALPAGAVPGE